MYVLNLTIISSNLVDIKQDWYKGRYKAIYKRQYKARSKLKNLTIDDIGLGRQGENKIFIQESLTPSRRELFHKSNEFKKKFRFRYIWSFYGNIFLRKDDASPAVKICSLKDLAKLEAKLKPSLSTGMEECLTVTQISSADSNGTDTGWLSLNGWYKLWRSTSPSSDFRAK